MTNVMTVAQDVAGAHSPLGTEKILDFLTVYLHIGYLHLTR